MPNLQNEIAARTFYVSKKTFGKLMYRKTELENPFTLNCPDERDRKIVPQKLPLGSLVTRRLPCLTVQPLTTSFPFT